MTDLDLKKIWSNSFNKEKNKSRKCLVQECNKPTIKSHTLQKNGILNQISEKNHLYQLSNVSPFQRSEKGNLELRKIGINEVYTFPGFCKDHDSSIFRPIEKSTYDLSSPQNINLFSYRALCQEIRRKEIAMDISDILGNTNFNIPLIVYMHEFRKGLVNGLKNLNFFKNELEKDYHNNERIFNHQICEIPRTEICITAPLNIKDPKNPLTESHDNTGNFLNKPFVTTIISIFPYQDKSYLMTSIHKDYQCNWTSELFEKFKKSNKDETLKLISDLVTTRIEFWCLSPTLKSKISDEKFKELVQIWNSEVWNYDSKLITDFNLFV